MQRLRTARHIARLVLVWFALSIGAALASPLVKPQSLELICSAAGALTLQTGGGDAGQPAAGHMPDCPLCATPGTPPPAAYGAGPQPLALSYATHPVATASCVSLSAPPLPARGPPRG